MPDALRSLRPGGCLTILVGSGSVRSVLKRPVTQQFIKFAAVGILVTIVCQILKKSDREDIATIVSLAGLVIVLAVVLDMVVGLFDSVRNIFDLF